jgi:hypothetical protein
MTSRRDVTGMIREVIPKWPNFVLYFQVAGWDKQNNHSGMSPFSPWYVAFFANPMMHHQSSYSMSPWIPVFRLGSSHFVTA